MNARAGAAPRNSALGAATLIFVAALWGSTFPVTKDLIARVPPADLLVVRYGIATVALALFAGRRLHLDTKLWLRGAVLGLLIGGGLIVQSYGLVHTPASVSGFITGLYVVITPLLGWLALKDRIPAITWVAAVVAAVGLAILSLQIGGAGISVGMGELLTLASAALFAAHIVAASVWSTPKTSLSLAVVQGLVITLLSALFVAPTGRLVLPSGWIDWGAMLYLALLAGAGTLFLQVWAQAHLAATTAAVIMSTEPVFSAVFAVAFGGEVVTWRMLLGGLTILTAMYLVVGPRPRLKPPSLGP